MHLHVEEAGQGPPVVLLHGGGPGASGASNFAKNLPVFAERFRTLVVDQPGYGKSDKPPVQGNYFTFAAGAHRLRNRVLLIWGREDRVNPVDGALVALKLIRRAQLHVFGGCGHWAQLEKFDEFNRLAISFLEGDGA